MTPSADLNLPEKEKRLQALKDLIQQERQAGNLPMPRPYDANNHIHTFYSFSPYSPTYAAYKAYRSGLNIAGIVDHDTLSGVHEFHEACEILRIASTGGVEMRVKFRQGFGTINNPDQPDCMYMIAHGVPLTQVDAFNTYLARFRSERELRNRQMVERLNDLCKPLHISLDYDRDVRPRSKAVEGGSVTERHLLYALALKLDQRFGRTPDLIQAVETTFSVHASDKQRGWLTDPHNDIFFYDLLGLIKTNTTSFFIPATDEMPDAKEFVETAKQFLAIPAYAYLGDVGVSVTGDKRAQKFEDRYLDQLIPALKAIGIPAIAYMPTRNTPIQLARLQQLCRQYGFMEISGEDINSPRQGFHCDAYQNPDYRHLINSAWSLVGHEIACAADPKAGLFGSTYPQLSLSERILHFSNIGKNVRRTLK